MRKVLFSFLLIAVAFTSCSNDFEVNADWKEFGIVYGLLDLSKSQQYIRVNKAFLDDIEPIQGATEIASATPDSIYFSENISVWLDEYNDNGNFIRKIDLGRVSGTDAGLAPKEEGVFNNSEYYVYTSAETIKSEHRYDLTVITDQGEEMTASTNLADNFNITVPNDSFENPALASEYELAAFDETTMRWFNSNNASIYDVVMRVNINEFNTLNPDPQVADNNYDIYWTMASNIKGSNTEAFSSLKFRYDNFLNFLQNTLDPKPEVFRTINYIEYIVSAGTSELEQYRNVALAAGTNLNAGQAKPIFSNIENGIGIFASTNTTRRRVLRLTNNTKKDIACNPVTADLNFSPNYQVLFENCP